MLTISTATEKPTYANLAAFQNALNTNALSVLSTRRGGELRHLALVLPPADYASVSADHITFIPPKDPSTIFIQPEGAITAHISENNCIFEIRCSEYSIYINACQALQKLVLYKVHPTYLKALCHPITQFSQVHSITLLNHLWTTYG